MHPALAIGVSYLLGSIPFGLLLGLARGVDIRKSGSGNIGATNLGRALGRPWAIAAFLLDYLKGLAPPLFVLANDIGGEDELGVAVLCAASSIAGHVFPIYLKFRGGKGVATGFGAMTALSWVASSAAAVLWFAVYRSTRAVSVASIVAALCFPLGTWFAYRAEEFEKSWPTLAFASAVALLILIRHRENIRRLLRGEELVFRSKAPESAASESTADGSLGDEENA